MAMELARVMELFSLFSDLEGEALARWQGLCETASARLEARVRADVDAAAHGEALAIAAAGIAYGDYLAVSGGGAGDEVRVGDITVRGGAAASGDAAEIQAHFYGQVAHLLEPECPALFPA